MLRADAEKYGTSLDEYEELIAEVEANRHIPTQEELGAQAQYVQEQLLAEAKAAKELALSVLTVTTQSGKTFDANNQARLDLSNAITISDTVGIAETTWRLADNSEVVVTVSELKEALVLALTEYARIKGIGQ